MYIVHIRDLILLVICGARKGRNEINDNYFILCICRPCCVHISNPCTWMAQVKSDKVYPNRVVCFDLNRACTKIEHPTCLVNTLFVGHFDRFLLFAVWPNSGHF